MLQRQKYWIILLSGMLSIVSCEERNHQRITIAAAANMQFVIKELVADFSDKSGLECDLVISSSGKLTAQIVEGAPYDILVAANMKYPELIHSKGLSQGQPQIYAYGKLVLWSADPSITPGLDLLLDKSVANIALANPKTAPYGEAAIQVLTKKGIIDSIQEKLVYGESIAQTNQFIITESAVLGFTALSVVMSEKMKDRGKWLAISQEDYDPIAQGAVLLKRNDTLINGATKFYDYLFSEDAGKILEEFGYSRHE